MTTAADLVAQGMWPAMADSVTGVTDLNGLTITATTGTLTIADGKEAKFDNTLRFAGTDSTTFTFPSVNATIPGVAVANTWTAHQTFTDVNIILSTTTGTKIGTSATQKLGFWNATPVVQQVLATGAGATVDNVIALLQTLGLCKQS